MKELYRYERNIQALYDWDGNFIDESEEREHELIRLVKLKVIKETEKSYLVRLPFSFKTKRVFKNVKSSYAYDTKERAFENYKHRCSRALAYAKMNLRYAEIFNENVKETLKLKQ